MPANAIERIRHYNKMLIAQHKFVGGTVLHGYGLNTRVFQWRSSRTVYAWGADYTPAGPPNWLERRIFRRPYDDELGLVGTATSESWLSVAKATGRAATTVTQYEYTTGYMGIVKPFVAIAENRFEAPISEITLDHIRGGLGYMRGIELPRTTTDAGHIENLAARLQAAAGWAIAQDG